MPADCEVEDPVDTNEPAPLPHCVVFAPELGQLSVVAHRVDRDARQVARVGPIDSVNSQVTATASSESERVITSAVEGSVISPGCRPGVADAVPDPRRITNRR